MTALDLTGVTKRYGETTALDDVSLDVDDGEFFTLVGPSGCGKTTMLRLVGGFESPTEGEIRFDGRDVSGVPPEERGIGVVFQSYALFPHMSVAENVAYGLRFSDPPGGVSRRERVRELLSLVDLDGFEERDPTELSGGQQQRVALARALAPGPRVLLLDEPMSALDAGLRERLRAQVKEIQRELGVTTLYVTHDQEEALAVSDRVAVMNRGRVEQVGTPQEVYRRPESPFVASFVGDNNLFEGRVVGRDDGTVDVDVGETMFEIRANGEGGPTVGEDVTFAVRPERLRTLAEDEAVDGSAEPNRLRAQVVRSEFLGETTRVWLDWEGREVTARASESLAGTVTLAFAAEDAQIVRVG
ncbi:ABC transporter ATP-binding protein [Salinigranum rubrum]|uniref:Molybdate/tungstate import ATP-binding protein WtpC n=1 Tax=Salinigranum rubrum TaxID=755307 RepID=A0A2I8VPF8_9EURY|nr:ABC transporter ATP-binding protein [Salinigranum rubrum]AUV83803.1 ABC transporter ATP-binding protein [Salinigranum rubrum]